MKYILVSACLMGKPCRYDGKSNRCQAVIDLKDREDICLVPVCPEQLGGLPTPRIPSERTEDAVINQQGEDVTDYFTHGAAQTLKIAEQYGCKQAILKERSPSCGCGEVYDGSFTHTIVEGDGVTTELLRRHGILVCGESNIFPL
ncbi:MAG: DUF523 domain-containing protein [Faecousia sp.]